MNRKEFMRLGGSHLRNALMGWFSSWEVLEEPRHVDPSPAPAALRGLRPPGAVAEERFLEACTHCGLCVEACPHDAIALAGARDDYPEGTPYLPNVAAKPCHLCEDMPCVAACETGALLRLSGEEVRMGLAEIDPDLCFAYRGQLCDYCIDRCPFPDEAIAADEHGRPVVNPDRCVGCGLCAYICVTTPGAIAVRPRTPRKEEPCSA